MPKKNESSVWSEKLAMLPSYFVHLRQKSRLRPELSPKVWSTLGLNPTRKAWPDLQLCFTIALYRKNSVNTAKKCNKFFSSFTFVLAEKKWCKLNKS